MQKGWGRIRTAQKSCRTPAPTTRPRESTITEKPLISRQFATSDGCFDLLLACSITGLPVGLGNAEEECLADAVANSYYYPEDSEDNRQVDCTKEFVREHIRTGGLTFSTADESAREPDENGNSDLWI